MWRDEHHLTATYAASLAPYIDAQLVAILNNWAGTPAAASPASPAASSASAPPSAAPSASPGS